MFERFTERARQVVILAQEEARALRHNYIGTEHVLLGLLRDEQGLAASVLQSLGITADDVREDVVSIIGTGSEAAAGQIPFTPRAKKVLELSLREALQLGHNYIGTEHLLLGLVRENEGVAASILRDRGSDAESVRTAVVRAVSAGEGTEEVVRLPSRTAPLPGTPRPEVLSGVHVDLAASAMRALEGAAAEALTDGRRQLDAADLLAALADLDDKLLRAVLERLAVDPGALRQAVAEVRPGASSEPSA